MPGRIDGKVAFITGAARGQGRGHAVRLAQAGADIIVVANAGIGALGASLAQMTQKTWQDTIDINLTGVWLTAKAGIPHLIAGGRGGSIVLTSSVGGVKGMEGAGHYVAAKHGVVGLMRTLALEMAHHKIRVNTIMPTQVNTPMAVNEGTFRLFRPDLENPTIDDFAAASAMTNPLQVPWMEPEDISNAVLFLACDESRYITGVALPVDAGSMVR